MNKQFIERNQVVIGTISAILIVATLVASLAVTRNDLTGGYTITASFEDANGLRTGDLAVVAGIQAGTVTGLEIVGEVVEVSMEIDGDVELPVDTRAEITVRTLVGKKAVNLIPGDFSGELMTAGHEIPIGMTDVVLDVPQLAETAEDFLTEIDSEALNTLLVAVSDVTRDQREEVARLVDSGTDLTELVNSQEDQIRLLLRNLSTLAQTLESRDDELIAIIDDLDVALANLANRRADVQRLLQETRDTSTVTADFLARVRADLDAVLDEVHIDLEIVNRHQVDIAEALAYIGDGIVGFSSISFAQGEPVTWGHVFVTSLGPVGLDIIAGCGGIVDQQIDLILGPDPRTCEEQGSDTFPDDLDDDGGDGDGGAPIPDIPLDIIPAAAPPIERAPQRLGSDFGPRSLHRRRPAAARPDRDGLRAARRGRRRR